MNFLTKLAIAGVALSSVAASNKAEVKVERQRYAADVVLTSSNSISMNGVFDAENTARTILAAKAIDSKTPSNDPIYLVLNSPGGSIDAGISMIEQLSTLNRPVITVTLFAASMGFQTVQGIPGKRYVTSSGTLMSHRPKGGFSGEFAATGGGGSQLSTRYKYYQERVARMDQKAVERTNGKLNFNEYEALIVPEYWCDGQACVDQGFADKVVTVMCDQSLNTSTTREENTSFMGFEMHSEQTTSNCPLITGSPMGSARTINGFSVNEVDMRKLTGYNQELEMAINAKFKEIEAQAHPSDYLNEYLKGMKSVIGY